MSYIEKEFLKKIELARLDSERSVLAKNLNSLEEKLLSETSKLTNFLEDTKNYIEMLQESSNN